MRVFRIVFALVAFCVMPAAVMAAEDHSHTLSLPADKDAPAAESDHQENIYFCPMHPHIRGEKGDRCPICGMELVPASSAAADLDALAVKIEPAQRRLANIQTAKVEVARWLDGEGPGRLYRTLERIRGGASLEAAMKDGR